MFISDLINEFQSVNDREIKIGRFRISLLGNWLNLSLACLLYNTILIDLNVDAA
jgi:hypothetical protein